MSKHWVKFENGSREDFEGFLETIKPHHHVRILFTKNQVTGDLNELLERLPKGTNLGYLSLEGSTFQDKDLARLSCNSRFNFTYGVNLGNCGFTDRGLAKFVQTPLMAGVRELFLDNRVSSDPERINQVGDFAAQAMALSPQLQTLQTLGFWNTQLGNAGLKALIESTKLPKLASVCAWKTRVTEDFHQHIADLCRQSNKVHLHVQTDYNIPPIDYFGGDYD